MTFSEKVPTVEGTGLRALSEKWREQARTYSQYKDPERNEDAKASFNLCADELDAALLLAPVDLREWAQHKPECQLITLVVPVTVKCPRCGKQYESNMGNRIYCIECGHRFTAEGKPTCSPAPICGLSAALARLPEKAGWHPIETAPKDEVLWFWVRPKTSKEAYTDTSGNSIFRAGQPCVRACKFKTWSALETADYWMRIPWPSPPVADVSQEP